MDVLTMMRMEHVDVADDDLLADVVSLRLNLSVKVPQSQTRPLWRQIFC